MSIVFYSVVSQRVVIFFFQGSGDHRDLHVLKHSFPTRRSSELDRNEIVRVRATGRYARRSQDAWKVRRTPGCAGRGQSGEPCKVSRMGKSRVVTTDHVLPPIRYFAAGTQVPRNRSEEHTSELQSLMRISYAVFCLKKKTK